MIQQEKAYNPSSTNVRPDESLSHKYNKDLEKECLRLKQAFSQPKRPASSQPDGKENSIQNQYKRAKESEKNLQEYQEKYERLEQNFKKFTDNLYKRRQKVNQSLNQSLQYDEGYVLSPIKDQHNPMNSSMIIGHELSMIENESMALQQIHNPAQESRFFNRNCENLDFSSNERVLQLKQLILRLNTFGRTAIEKLMALSVSKSQEYDLKDLCANFQTNLQTTVKKLNDIDNEQLETECEHVSSVFGQFLGCIEERFVKIFYRICQVESETFKNYKFKDALALFEHIIQEAHRMNLQEFMPSIAQSLARLRFQSAIHLMNKIISIKFSKRNSLFFKKWRQNAGLTEYITWQKKKQSFQKTIKAWSQRVLNLQKNRSLQIWKGQCLSNKQFQEGQAIFSLILKEKFYSANFNMNKIALKINEIMFTKSQIVCEVIQIQDNDYFFPQEKEPKQINIGVFQDLSITGHGIKEQILENDLFQNQKFNEKIDTPFIQSMDIQKEGLNMFIVPSQKYMIRFFSSTPFGKNKKGMMEELSAQLFSYLDKITAFKSQLDYLQSNLAQEQEKSSQLEFHKLIKDITSVLLQESEAITQDTQFVQIIKEHFDTVLDSLIPQMTLKNIFYESKSLIETEEEEIIVKHQNIAEGKVYEDLLNYENQDQLLHQLQVTQNNYIFVFQRRTQLALKGQVSLLKQYQKDVISSMSQIVIDIYRQTFLTKLEFQSKIDAVIAEKESLEQDQNSKDFIYDALTNLVQEKGYENLQDLYSDLHKIVKEGFVLGLKESEFDIKDVVIFLNSNILNESMEEGRLISYVNTSEEHKFNSNQFVVIKPKNGTIAKVEIPQQSINSEINILKLKEGSSQIQIPIQTEFGVNLAIVQIVTQNEVQEQSLESQRSFFEVFQSRISQTLTKVNKIQQNNVQLKSYIAAIEEELQNESLSNALKDRLSELFIQPLLNNNSIQQLGKSVKAYIYETTEHCPHKISAIYSETQQMIEDITQFDLSTKDVESEIILSAIEQRKNVVLDEAKDEFHILVYVQESQDIYFLISFKEAQTIDQVIITQQIDILSPIIQSFLKGNKGIRLSHKKEQLLLKVKQIFDQRMKHYTYQFILHILDFQAKNSFNFTKTSIYANLFKNYQEFDKSVFNKQVKILQNVCQKLNTFEHFANKKMQVYFNSFKDQTTFIKNECVPVEKKKGVSQLFYSLRKMIQQRTFQELSVHARKLHCLKQQPVNELLLFKSLQINYERILLRNALKRFKQRTGQKHLDLNNNQMKDMRVIFDLSQILNQQGMNLEEKLMRVMKMTNLHFKSCLGSQMDQIIISIKNAKSKTKGFKFRNQVSNLSTLEQIQSGYATPSKTIANQLQVEDVLRLAEKKITGEKESDFEIFDFSSKRDIIMQMLEKSGSILNFQNISQSLQELYLQLMAKHPNGVPKARFKCVQSSKCALIVPIRIPYQNEIIGSFEIYRSQNVPFQEDVEVRMSNFASYLSSIFSSYQVLKAQASEVELMKKQLVRNHRWTSSLSSYLKHIYVSAPSMLNADSVLPILLAIDEKVDSRLAFFFQFKDNHIYNFNFTDTFIEEIVESGCTLEVTPKAEGEKYEEDIDESVCSLDFDMMSGREHKRRTVRELKVQSVCGEQYKHIIYYPVIDKHGKTQVILEVCYNRLEKIPSQITNEPIKMLMEQFSFQMVQFQSVLKSFCASLNVILEKKKTASFLQAFAQIKLFSAQIKQRDEYHQVQVKTVIYLWLNIQSEQTEHYFSEYIKNLESYDEELRKLVDEREEMVVKMKEMKVEKKAKLKFLATSLFFLTNLEKKFKNQQAKNSFMQWKWNVQVNQIAQSAFNKVLELNHKHSYARFRAGCKLIDNAYVKVELRDKKMALIQIFRYVKQKSYKFGPQYMTEGTTQLSCSQQFNLSQDRNSQGLRGSYQQISMPKMSQTNQSLRSSSQLGGSGCHQYPNQHSISIALSELSQPYNDSQKRPKRKNSSKKRN